MVHFDLDNLISWDEISYGYDCYFDLTGGNYNAFELIDEFVERIETNGAVKRLSDNSIDLTIGSTTTWTWAYDRKTLNILYFIKLMMVILLCIWIVEIYLYKELKNVSVII